MKGTTLIDQEAHELAHEIDDIFAQGWSGVAQRTSFVQIKLRSALLRISQAASSEPPRASAGPGTKPSRARPPGLIRTTIQPGSREDLALSFAASLRTTTPVLWEDWLKLADLLDTIKVEHLPPGYVSPIMWSVFSLRENIRQFHAHAHTQKAEKVSGNKGGHVSDRDVWPPARPRPEDAERDVDRQLRQASDLLDYDRDATREALSRVLYPPNPPGEQNEGNGLDRLKDMIAREEVCDHVFSAPGNDRASHCVYCGVDEVVDPDFAEVEEAPRPRMKPVADGDLGDDEEAPPAR
jgi:hypothetical protein